MYAPHRFREERAAVLADAVRAIRFASLVTGGADDLSSVHLPLTLVEAPGGWTLEGHVARANPIWRSAAAGVSALAIFQGPHAYVHPGWYPGKAVDGRVVPTWNYVVVEARGRLSIERDPARLRAGLSALTDLNEAGRPQPWSIDDAPSDYIDAMICGIVGIRLAVSAWTGVWKMAQHHAASARTGVIDGLAASRDPRDRAVAEAMRGCGAGKPE